MKFTSPWAKKAETCWILMTIFFLLWLYLLKWKSGEIKNWKEGDEKIEKKTLNLHKEKRNLHKIINYFFFGLIVIWWYLNKIYSHFTFHLTTQAYTNDFWISMGQSLNLFLRLSTFPWLQSSRSNNGTLIYLNFW